MLTLINATKERNGIIVKKIKINGNVNSCELRKVGINGRDNGYIASVNSSGFVVVSGQSWRGKISKSPLSFDELQKLVNTNFVEIKKRIEEGFKTPNLL